MKAFMDKDFLLTTDWAKKLYHEFAEVTPILDYHCHINPRDIYEDKAFDNITQVWLGGDHYKWRQMRANGVDEYYITGPSTPREKFQKWVETLELLIGNPLYHWSHLELQRYFGYHGVLNTDTCEEVWNLCNEQLRNGLTPRKLIQMSNVKLICTTDDPIDSLEWHRLIKADETFDVQVLPAFRPDRAMNQEKADFLDYLQQLSTVSGVEITSFKTLMEALSKRMDFFAENGCTVSDHAPLYVMHAPCSEEELEAIFAKRLANETLTAEEDRKYKFAFLQGVGKEYNKRNWVFQLHFGAKRDNSKRIFRQVGADGGIDCISNYIPGDELADFLNALDDTDELPKTILYSLNPIDNAMICTVMACFQGTKAVGKIQQGSAWWFNDHKPGITEQLTYLGANGTLGNFVGMLTDSRSFLSYTRHEYFRRVLCDLIGGWVENGEYPADEKALERIIKGICYNNAVRYFEFDL